MTLTGLNIYHADDALKQHVHHNLETTTEQTVILVR